MAREINLFEFESSPNIPPTTIEEQKAKVEEKPNAKGQAKTKELDLFEFANTQRKEKWVRQHLKQIIEALLFTSSSPLSFCKIREITDTFESVKPKVLRGILEELQQEYLTQQRSYRLEEIAQGFLLRTCQEYSPYIELLHRNKRTEKLSQAAAEVLAIIAYKNPITRPQIEAIRGVDCSGIVQSLLERQLVEPVGKLDVPGRPTLYGVTNDFLKHFGLRDLEQLRQSQQVLTAR